MAPPRILVVDDEPSLSDVVSAALRLVDFETETASTGIEALRLARTGRFDLIVLDVMLPDLEGFEVCRRLRAEGESVPILFLTARTDATDATEGLRIGGDDYVRKPFHLEELVARVRALLRRGGPQAPDTDVLVSGDITVDLRSYEVSRAGRPIEMTPTELRLMEVLARNRGRILTKDQIVEAVWDVPGAVERASVETVVSRVRRKLEEHGGRSCLVTRRGVGYGFMPSVDPG